MLVEVSFPRGEGDPQLTSSPFDVQLLVRGSSGFLLSPLAGWGRAHAQIIVLFIRICCCADAISTRAR